MLPTLEHELIDSRWAVYRSRKPEVVIDSLHDLRKEYGQSKGSAHSHSDKTVEQSAKSLFYGE